MGRSPMAPEVFNCSAPDTGQHGSAGPLRHARAEGALARTAAGRGDPLLLRHDRAGRRLLRRHQHPRPHRAARATSTSSTAASGGPPGAGDPRCKIAIFMGKTDPAAPPHQQQSMILVPMDTPGVTVKRMLTVFGYDDAPHGHARGALRERARAGGEHAARRGARLRDRAGPARARGASTTACG